MDGWIKNLYLLNISDYIEYSRLTPVSNTLPILYTYWWFSQPILKNLESGRSINQDSAVSFLVKSEQFGGMSSVIWDVRTSIKWLKYYPFYLLLILIFSLLANGWTRSVNFLLHLTLPLFFLSGRLAAALFFFYRDLELRSWVIRRCRALKQFILNLII